MKKILLFTLSLFITLQLCSQSTIDTIYFDPAIPTTADTIYLFADLTFPSTGCPLDNAGSSVVDNNIIAWTHHCIGAATAICNATDTIKIAPLAAGEYNVILSLTAGFDAIPCTPGIIVDDMDTIGLKIIESTATEDHSIEQMKIHPNPTMEYINFSSPLPAPGALFSMSGKSVLEIKAKANRINISHFEAGVYVLRCQQRAWKIIKI